MLQWKARAGNVFSCLQFVVWMWSKFQCHQDKLLVVLWFCCLLVLVLIPASVFTLLTDDGPYSKGSKDSGGMDAALVSRRQSIPGKGGDQFLLHNIGASITRYLATPKMGKTLQNTHFGASISKAFAGGQKWMVVTSLGEWYVAGAITVWCGAVNGGYSELGKDWFLRWADTHKEENSSKKEREEVPPRPSSLGGEGDWQCLASFVFPMCD